jgi:hypothetical protein
MAGRPQKQILDEIVKEQGKSGQLGKKLKANKARNWLLSLTLNSFAKLDENEPRSDIEETIVNAFRNSPAYTEEELKELGRTYKSIPGQARKDLFPGKFADLDTKTKYSLQDLNKDLPKIKEDILKEKNVLDVDVQAIHDGTAAASDFPMVSRDVAVEHGGTMLVAVAPNTTPPNPRYTIKAVSFRCNDETGTDFLGSDEPFWIFGSLGLGTAVTTRSQTFGDVDTGESRTFGANEGCIWGQNCLPQDFPEGEVGTHIQLWEHDHGDPAKIQAGVAAAFAAAAGILAATGVAAWVAAVVAGVGAVLQWLLGFLDDDHLADQTFVYTRQVVEDQLKKAGQSFNVVRRFIGNGGDYTLTTKVTRFA